jgi:hypothetical protein
VQYLVVPNDALQHGREMPQRVEVSASLSQLRALQFNVVGLLEEEQAQRRAGHMHNK